MCTLRQKIEDFIQLKPKILDSESIVKKIINQSRINKLKKE